MRTKKAFTLIELLVVIAIIAILAAILFPVFAQAKLAAKQTSSLSNNKQVTLAHMMYVTDYDDVQLPYLWYNRGDGEWVTWMHMLNPYVKNMGIFMNPAASTSPVDYVPTLATTCPSANPKVSSHWVTPMWIKSEWWNWFGTIMFAGFPVEHNPSTAGACGPAAIAARPWSACVGFTRVDAPAEVALVIPGYMVSYERLPALNNPFGWPCITGFGPFFPPNGPVNTRIQVFREGGNYGMADGHAKWFSVRNMNGNNSHVHNAPVIGPTPASPYMKILE
jgi:prepilin-type N-terminal cleavage/methylation domain-containing protein/prepilin-type processing-associated H-X9-DG protein